MTKDKTLNKALEAMRRPGAKLVHLHGRAEGFYLWPSGGKVLDEIARALLENPNVQPFDSGLLPGHPQSWKLCNRPGAWRNWKR
jgi:hypothetical protein